MNKLLQITAFIFLSSLLYGQPLDIQFGATLQPENWNQDVKRSMKIGDGIGIDTFSVEGVDHLFWDSAGYSVTRGHNILASLGFQVPHYGILTVDTANEIVQWLVIAPNGTYIRYSDPDIERVLELTGEAGAINYQFNDSLHWRTGGWQQGAAEYGEGSLVHDDHGDVAAIFWDFENNNEYSLIIQLYDNAADSLARTTIAQAGQLHFSNVAGYNFETEGNFIIDADTTRITNLSGNGNAYVTTDNEGNLGSTIPLYREYAAIITQVEVAGNFDSITVYVQNNTIGDITFSRTTDGTFEVESAGLFTANKTMFYIPETVSTFYGDPNSIYSLDIRSVVISDSLVNLYTYFSDGLADMILGNTPVLIRVYD